MPWWWRRQGSADPEARYSVVVQGPRSRDERSMRDFLSGVTRLLAECFSQWPRAGWDGEEEFLQALHWGLRESNEGVIARHLSWGTASMVKNMVNNKKLSPRVRVVKDDEVVMPRSADEAKGNSDSSESQALDKLIKLAMLKMLVDVAKDGDSGEGQFRAGTHVRVDGDVEALKRSCGTTPDARPGWHPLMEFYAGAVGIVQAVSAGTALVTVRFCDGKTYHFKQESLSRADEADFPRFAVRDRVFVCDDVRRSEALQDGHGAWVTSMAQRAGTEGTVVTVTDDGDCYVQFADGGQFVYSPMLLLLTGRPHAENGDDAQHRSAPRIDEAKIAQIKSLGFTHDQAVAGLSRESKVERAVEWIVRRWPTAQPNPEPRVASVSPSPTKPSLDEDKIACIMEIGYTRDQACEGLRRTTNVDAAVVWIMTNLGNPQPNVPPPAPPPVPRVVVRDNDPSPSSSGSPRRSFDEDKIAKITALGYTRDQAREGLRRTTNLDRAVEWIMSNSAPPPPPVDPPSPATPPSSHQPPSRPSPWTMPPPPPPLDRCQDDIRVVVPPDWPARSKLVIRAPDGQRIVVAVPDGLGPGDEFKVAFAPAAPAAPVVGFERGTGSSFRAEPPDRVPRPPLPREEEDPPPPPPPPVPREEIQQANPSVAVDEYKTNELQKGFPGVALLAAPNGSRIRSRKLLSGEIFFARKQGMMLAVTDSPEDRETRGWVSSRAATLVEPESCPVCFLDFDNDDDRFKVPSVGASPCSHFVHKECFVMQIRSTFHSVVDNGGRLYCVAAGCGATLDQASIVRHLPADKVQDFESLVTKGIAKENGLVVCKICEQPCFTADVVGDSARCSCGNYVCPRCGNPAHSGEPCPDHDLEYSEQLRAQGIPLIECPFCGNDILAKAEDDDSCERVECPECKNRFCNECKVSHDLIKRTSNASHKPDCRFYAPDRSPADALVENLGAIGKTISKDQALRALDKHEGNLNRAFAELSS
ncbi:hypothetical protein CTAYLR_008610 [Chrysophaeum taylorii]|uniref:RING-type E3 ubiquitin transferase n=1 Tax=Chrysophaeum taylorii TaxID=2483200 RepID=A0AAD7XRN3_9STRA|nr:hypothetical protein CTAYLR_008610 [Chrysophaeum taylorii]